MKVRIRQTNGNVAVVELNEIHELMCYSRGITEDKYGIMIYFHAGHYMEVEFCNEEVMWKTYDQLMKLLEPNDVLPVLGDINKK